MIENYRSQLVWKTMRKNPYVVEGLRRAGFRGGWLAAAAQLTAIVSTVKRNPPAAAASSAHSLP